ncbi:MAG: sensor histidine kinase [Clostridia bacterium]
MRPIREFPARVKAWQHHISVKITLYFLLAFLAALLLVILTMSSLFRDRLSEEVSLVVGQKMSLAATRLDNQLGEIRSLYFTLVRDPILNSSMRLLPEQRTLSKTLEMKEEIARITARYSSVRSIILIAPEGEILDPIYAAEPYRSLLLNDPEYEAFMASPYSGRFSAPSTFPLLISNPTDRQKDTITYFGHYYDLESYETLGTVAINVARLSLLGEAQTLFSETFDSGMILDEHANVILRAGSNPNITPLAMTQEGGEHVRIDGNRYARFQHRLAGYPNWTLWGLVSYEHITSPIHSLYFALSIVSTLVVLLFAYLGVIISRRVTAPLRRLNHAMARLGKGEWVRVAPETATTEIEELFAGYNEMVASVHHLTDRITQEQVDKRRIKVAMIQSQLDLLQSQINPHFIHNTLNTMRYLAQKENAPELADMVQSFNALLRASMSETRMTNALSEEFENLNHYMRIQKKRYDVALVFLLDAQEDALKVQVPKLLLQPLVENALFHGIAPVGQGTIKVLARLAEGRLWLSVSDDGAGIPPEVLRQLLAGQLHSARGYNQIGLSNVNDRLTLFYGEASRLVIESIAGKGTTIGFSIPESGPDDRVKNE